MRADRLGPLAMMDDEAVRRALLGGSHLTAVCDAGGEVTHYRVAFHDACCGVGTFERLRPVLEEMGSGRWGLSARGRYRMVEGSAAARETEAMARG